MIKKKLYICFIVIGLFFTLYTNPTLAATFTVNSTTDAWDVSGGDGVCATSNGVCTLRAAIIEANRYSGSDTITFSVDGTFKIDLTGMNKDDGYGDLNIVSDITIQGNGTDKTIIDGNASDRIFYIEQDQTVTPAVIPTVTLSDLTIQNGSANIGGGGILNIGVLTVNHCIIQDNTALDSDGGGILNLKTLVLTDSTIQRNTAVMGGGLKSNGSNPNSTSVTISDSLIYDNSADSGGGIMHNTYNIAGILTINNSTISSNSATSFAGGIYQKESSGVNKGNTVNISYTTIVNNTAGTSGGGGIYRYINSNSFIITKSILANNLEDSTNHKNCNYDPIYTFYINSDGYNIDSGTTCGFANSTDQSNVTSTLNLGTLADNDGPTYTHALQANSTAALNQISVVNCSQTTDQRGVVRPQATNCDIGAYEFQDVDGDTSPSETDCNDSDATIHATSAFYEDADGDSLGNANVNTIACANSVAGYVTDSSDTNDQDADNDGVSSDSDCNDNDATITASPQTYYEDADSDSLGNVNSTVISCTQPSGYVTNSSDTDDETSSDTNTNQTDNTTPSDADKDGLSADQDCNDDDSSVTYTQTYYQDADADGSGGDTTTTICSNTTPSGYVTTTGDCNDNDATVITFQTYYQDADGDGYGNASVALSVCSATAPTGYVTNMADSDDTVSTATTEEPNDQIDNDGDGTVDEANTVEENGTDPDYRNTDPLDPAAFSATISSFKGKKDGKIKVTFIDGTVYTYPVYDIDTDSKTKVKQYEGSGYLLVLHPKGKKLALVNPYTGAVVALVSISSDQKYSSNGIKQANLRSDQDSKIEVVVTSLNEDQIHVVVVKVNLSKLKLTLKDDASFTSDQVVVSETKLSSKKITLRTASDSTVKEYQVNSDYTLK